VQHAGERQPASHSVYWMNFSGSLHYLIYKQPFLDWRQLFQRESLTKLQYISGTLSAPQEVKQLLEL
jgi:hypothetical protein